MALTWINRNRQTAIHVSLSAGTLTFSENGVSNFSFDGEGRLVGILSKKDCLEVAFGASYHQDWAGPVSGYMGVDVGTVGCVSLKLVPAFDRTLF